MVEPSAVVWSSPLSRMRMASRLNRRKSSYVTPEAVVNKPPRGLGPRAPHPIDRTTEMPTGYIPSAHDPAISKPRSRLMTETNRKLAALFRSIAAQLTLRDANPYRIRAYRRAADSLDRLHEDVGDIATRGALTEIPGIGRDLAAKIAEYVRAGTIDSVEELKTPLPPEVSTWTTLPGLSETVVRYLYQHLGIQTLEDLESLARSHLLRTLPGALIPEEELIAAIEGRRRSGAVP